MAAITSTASKKSPFTNEEKGTITGSVGTPFYVAPEIIRVEEYNNKCDIWSLGILAYELISGQPAFTAATTEETLNKILYQKVEFGATLWDNISLECEDFITKILSERAF